MKIVSLMENTSSAPQFAAEHGLSLYIETDKHKILFDSGASNAFADNAALLGINLSLVDIAVLSHGHSDHGGGLMKFLELNSQASVYLSQYAFGEYYSGTDRYIGLSEQLRENPRLIFTGEHIVIDRELELFSCNEKTCIQPLDSAGLTQKQGSNFIPDTFLHEQYLLIHSGDGRHFSEQTVLISGCSHKGILNIMHWFKPDVLIGGFHYMKEPISADGNPVLDKAATELSQYATRYYTCHCTGIEQFQYLKEQMGDKLNYLASGQELNI